MDRPRIHYEVLAQTRPGGAFALDSACEGRAKAIETANLLIEEKRALAVQVSKEAMDPASGEFSAVVIFERGAPQPARRAKPTAQSRGQPACTTPQDLYGLHARETIGRLLEPWLARQGVTVFELLHRADLLERLEASGLELQQALQRLAAPEAHALGVAVHELIRTYAALVERAIARVRDDHRRDAFPDLRHEPLVAAVARLHGAAERRYLLGGAVAGALAGVKGWGGKVDALLDLAEQALVAGEPGGAALSVLEPPLSEMLESRASAADVLGPQTDLGAGLAALTRLVAGSEAAAIVRMDRALAPLMPPLSGPAARLSRFFDAGAFPDARRAVGRRLLREVAGPRRLRPASPHDEIALIRLLAMTLTAAGDRLLDADDVRRAFVDRSRALLAPDFVAAFLADCDNALAEVGSLIWLAENVVGAANKRAAARLVDAALNSRRLDLELRATGGEPPAQRLATLARLQSAIGASGFQVEDAQALAHRIGDLGAVLESEVRLIALLLRADAEPTHKLFLLSKLASGESAPKGPVTERARQEVLKLMRASETRERLAASPELRDRLAALLPAAA